MKTPVLIALTALVLGMGAALAAMNNACKSDHHSSCAPNLSVRHQVKTETANAVPEIRWGADVSSDKLRQLQARKRLCAECSVLGDVLLSPFLFRHRLV